jgi:outer membrane protein OmpA-like peptidoglycan-associated protein
VNHAGFMAARAGSMHNATPQSISNAYVRNLAPMYGGGRDAEEIAGSLARATADMQGNYRIELLNPNKASFDSFNDPVLQKILKTEARVIPNSGLALKDPSLIKQPSKQNIFDANLLKLRITHGYEPKVALVAGLFVKALEVADKVQEEGRDNFVSILLAKGRVPVVTDVTLHMNSDAFEWADPVWISGGADGSLQTPSIPAAPSNPPAYTPPAAGNDANISQNANPPAHPNGDVDVNADSGGSTDSCGNAGCPVCKADIPASESFSLQADVLFDFDDSTLRTDGLDELDDFIEEARQAHEDGQRIASITISGYTDQLGSDGVNQRLSLERAEAVRDYMQKNGFPDVPVAVRGMGAADPKVPIESCTGGAQEQIACLAPNRRVLIEIKRTESQQ